METITIDAAVREKSGKGVARKLRRAERIPGVLNHGGQTIALDVDKKSLVKLINTKKSGYAVLNLNMTNAPDQKSRMAMVKEFQVHPVTRELIHVDFREVKAEEKVRIHLPVILKGTPVGVKLGGQLRVVTWSLDFDCLPSDIVDRVEMDISSVGPGKTVHASDLSLPSGLTLKSPPKTVLCQVSTVAAAEAAAEAAEASEAPAAAAPESKPADPGSKK